MASLTKLRDAIDELQEMKYKKRELEDRLVQMVFDSDLSLEDALVAKIVRCNFSVPAYFTKILNQKWVDRKEKG